MKKKILIVQAGTSSEREISLRTGKACHKAIKKLGYKSYIFDPAIDSIKKIKKLK